MFLAYHSTTSVSVCKNFHSGAPLFGDLGFLIDFQLIDGSFTPSPGTVIRGI
jgi:hypothetical protein